MRTIHFSSIALLALACSLEAPTVPEPEPNSSDPESTVNGNGAEPEGEPTDTPEDPNANDDTEVPNPDLPLDDDMTDMETDMTADEKDPMEVIEEPPPLEDFTAIAAPLEGMRIDDPCTGSPSDAQGATCTHVQNPFSETREVTLAGTAGTTYDVTLRIRGVVEPTRINGGTRPDTSTVNLDGRNYRALPLTIGGQPGDVTYQPWRLSISNPARDYYLNDYELVEHTIFSIDYEVTIEMDGNARVELDVTDGNNVQINNYERYSHEGISGSMNLGQFLQIAVVSVTPRP